MAKCPELFLFLKSSRHLSFLQQSQGLPQYRFRCLRVYMFFYLSVCLFVWLSVGVSAYVYTFVYFVSVYMHIERGRYILSISLIFEKPRYHIFPLRSFSGTATVATLPQCIHAGYCNSLHCLQILCMLETRSSIPLDLLQELHFSWFLA